MHPSSFENMQRCAERFLRGGFFDLHDRIVVADVGGADYNGGYRPIFAEPPFEYLSVDLASDILVDVVMAEPDRIPLADGFADVVISGQMLEHCEFFWDTFREMIRILNPDGYMFLIAPSGGPIHRYPVDCYRFYPDAFHALARYADCELVELFHDDRGPWNDLVGVFRHHNAPQYSADVRAGSAWSVGEIDSLPAGPWDESHAQNLITAGTHYLDVLKDIHAAIQPTGYVEIGVSKGKSLQLAQCPTIGIDPDPDCAVLATDDTQIAISTSDAYFSDLRGREIEVPVDLVFIDGMHLAEYVLRDFIAIERRAHAGTIVVIDDIFPVLPTQASRERKTKVWMGDVWKIVKCLRTYRPDLKLDLIDSAPSGLLLVSGLQPDNTRLSECYNPIVEGFLAKQAVPHEVLNRESAVDTFDPKYRQILSDLWGLSVSDGETATAVAEPISKIFSDDGLPVFGFRERDALGRFLIGDVLEVGPGSAPFPVGLGSKVRFLERPPSDLSRDELFPELMGAPHGPRADIECDLDVSGLAPVDTASVDGVVASHVLEHVSNPLRILSEFHRVLRPGGTLVLILPDRLKTFDAPRQPTSLAHLVDEYREEVTVVDDEHIIEFLSVVDGLPPESLSPEFIDFHRKRSIHAHCWDAQEAMPMLLWQIVELEQPWELEEIMLSDETESDWQHEFAYVLRKPSNGKVDEYTPGRLVATWVDLVLSDARRDPNRIELLQAALIRDSAALGLSDEIGSNPHAYGKLLAIWMRYKDLRAISHLPLVDPLPLTSWLCQFPNDFRAQTSTQIDEELATITKLRKGEGTY